MKLIIEGKVARTGRTALDISTFNACLLIEGQVAAQSQISTSGEYSLVLKADVMPKSAELMLLPSSANPKDAGRMALSKQISAAQFVPKKGRNNEFTLVDKFLLPEDFVRFIKTRIQKYHIHGTVYLEHATYFSPLPCCRIDFYEVDPVVVSPRPTLIRRKDFLGSAYTNSDGSYDFHFKFGPLPLKPFPVGIAEFSPHLPARIRRPDVFFDYKPDIHAHFFQYINGTWTKIYDAPMLALDWNIDTDFHRDYRIPAEVAVGVVDPGPKPATGFQFKSIGLLPIDATRIVNGYAYSQTGDPITGITHEPFCFSLRIYGLFAASLAVTTYAVEILRTNADGSPAITTAADGSPITEDWVPLGESLTNQKRNDTTHAWDPQQLHLEDGRYKNIDIEDPLIWLEPSLKAVWNTANRPNGYYKLRITGYNAANTAVVTAEMPMLRTDNDPPQADLDVLLPPTGKCGNLTIDPTVRKITLQVTAYEPDGHLYGYYISGSRGRYAESAGADLNHERLLADDAWYGVIDNAEEFIVSSRSTTTADCTTMAYSFHLRVQGAGTNGYGHCFEHYQKRIWKEINLVVTE